MTIQQSLIIGNHYYVLYTDIMLSYLLNERPYQIFKSDFFIVGLPLLYLAINIKGSIPF